MYNAGEMFPLKEGTAHAFYLIKKRLKTPKLEANHHILFPARHAMFHSLYMHSLTLSNYAEFGGFIRFLQQVISDF